MKRIEGQLKLQLACRVAYRECMQTNFAWRRGGADYPTLGDGHMGASLKITRRPNWPRPSPFIDDASLRTDADETPPVGADVMSLSAV